MTAIYFCVFVISALFGAASCIKLVNMTIECNLLLMIAILVARKVCEGNQFEKKRFCTLVPVSYLAIY